MIKTLPLLIAVLLALPPNAAALKTKYPDTPRLPAREVYPTSHGVYPDATPPVVAARTETVPLSADFTYEAPANSLTIFRIPGQ